MPELLLALDVGTTTVRAGVFTAGGDVASFARTRLTTTAPRPGWLEQDPARIWRAARRVMAEALAEGGANARDLAAIGVTTQRTSAMVWDRKTGEPLTPLVVWSDLRGAGRALELQQAGFRLAPQQAAAKLPALVEGIENSNYLSAVGRLAWGNIDSYLVYKLTGGEHVTDRSQAWPTGYLDPMTMGWNGALLAWQKLDERLFPRLVDTWGPMGETALGVLGARVPVCADIADQQAALIAHGDAPGLMKATYGTSATLNLGTGRELVARSAAMPPFVLSFVGGEATFCLEGMVYAAGSALDWLRAACALGDHARFAELAASVPDTAGAAFLPALQGLGAPRPDAARTGLLAGLTPAVGRGQLARAGMEGVAFRVSQVFEALAETAGGPAPDVLAADGGLAASDLFLQIQADLLQRPVRRHAVLEATACGAAIGAGRGVGLLTDSDARGFARTGRTFEPAIGTDEAQSRYAYWRGAVGV